MNKKVFISYAHKDEEFKDDLTEHMSSLKRSGIISEWNDRKIIPGQNWADEISENLKSSNVILFLISSSFMNSEYCMGVEVETALKMHKENEAQLIPIVIRPVDWSDTELSKLQGLPKDAIAISSWENQDEAWVDVISGLKKHIQEFKPVIQVQETNDENETKPSHFIYNWLEDTEIILTHRKVNKVKLSDIYTIPDVDMESEDKTELVNIKKADVILKSVGQYVLYGEDQQGKTSLLKFYYSELLKKDYLPLYIESSKIKKFDLEISLQKSVSEQYDNLTFKQFIESDKKVILIDNIDEFGLNPKYRNKYLGQLNGIFEFTVFTCHHSFRYILNDIPALDDHERLELLGLGHKKREEIVQKWISLGVQENINEEELYSECDELKNRLNIVIKKNIVPPKPIYVLMLLQMFEANAQLSLELTSYGHCYQQLIYQSFDKAKINKQDFDKYLNVLTELSWWIFVNGDEPNANQLDVFFEQYCKTYLAVDGANVVKKFINHSILNEHGIRTGFKYPYIYYYFVGKKIAESYSDSEETRREVKKLLSLLHREDFANILIFITHHTKDSWVINEIKSVLSDLFVEQEAATLDIKQLDFMGEFMNKIPNLVIEQREIQKERDLINQNLDHADRQSADDYENQDILANINKTFKGMEIAGQIIRNRHATLTRLSLEKLAESGTTAGLRFLNYFITMNDSAKKEIIKVITNHLVEHPNLSDSEIEKQAEDAYLHLTYGVINGVTRKIASTVGSKEALEIYDSLEKNSKNPALTLIKQSIDLQFNRNLDINNIDECLKSLQGNQVCIRILKEMVVQHIYMFPVNYRDKQKLSSLLSIPIQKQRLMDQKKAGKA